MEDDDAGRITRRSHIETYQVAIGRAVAIQTEQCTLLIVVAQLRAHNLEHLLAILAEILPLDIRSKACPILTCGANLDIQLLAGGQLVDKLAGALGTAQRQSCVVDVVTHGRCRADNLDLVDVSLRDLCTHSRV